MKILLLLLIFVIHYSFASDSPPKASQKPEKSKNVSSNSKENSAMLANDILTNEVQDDAVWHFVIGAGVAHGPLFEGSKDYGLASSLVLEVIYKDKIVLGLDNITYNLYDGKGLKISPQIVLIDGRKETSESMDGKEATLTGFNTFDPTLGIGGVVEYSFITSESGKVIAMISANYGVGGGYRGLLSGASIAYSYFGSGVVFNIGSVVKFAGRDYNEKFFGVSAEQSLNSGLQTYNPNFGIVSYGIMGSIIAPVSKNLAVLMLAGYTRLANTPSDSPLIKKYGDRNQYVGGISLIYVF